MANSTKTKPLAVSSVTVATELHAIQAEQRRLKGREEELRAQLFKSLKQQGVKSVRLDDGTMYMRSERHSLEALMTMKDKAYKWALEHNALKIDTAKSFQILRHELEMPKFFRVKTNEYLVVRRPGQADEE